MNPQDYIQLAGVVAGVVSPLIGALWAHINGKFKQEREERLAAQQKFEGHIATLYKDAANFREHVANKYSPHERVTEMLGELRKGQDDLKAEIRGLQLAVMQMAGKGHGD